ncbi:MAG: two-CW domain-containing protein [Candidatus Zixiibacteriota bacterium]
MYRKLNCWEYHNCGMEPGGMFADIKNNPCPIPSLFKFDGINDGRGAGRYCWMIQDKTAGGNHEFICRNSNKSCCHCPFYIRVQNEEAEVVRQFELTAD